MNRIQSYIYPFIFLALICPNSLYAQVASGTLNGHEYVDLGLSVKWATCNVGADSPEEYGDYYAWGETTTKLTYTEENSKTYGNISCNFDIGSNSDLDAATANWGDTWRLPTLEEMMELVDECTWTWIVLDGEKGYKVTGPNSCSIFLPAAGYRDEASLYHAGQRGNYWASTPIKDYAYRSFFLGFFGSSYHVDWRFRNRGCSVRPVTK